MKYALRILTVCVLALAAATAQSQPYPTRPVRMAGLLSNGVWTGVPLAAVLKEAGVKPEAREVVFLGADL